AVFEGVPDAPVDVAEEPLIEADPVGSSDPADPIEDEGTSAAPIVVRHPLYYTVPAKVVRRRTPAEHKRRHTPAAGGGNRKGVPLWAALGLPLAAASVLALTAALSGDGAGDASEEITLADAETSGDTGPIVAEPAAPAEVSSGETIGEDSTVAMADVSEAPSAKADRPVEAPPEVAAATPTTAPAPALSAPAEDVIEPPVAPIVTARAAPRPAPIAAVEAPPAVSANVLSAKIASVPGAKPGEIAGKAGTYEVSAPTVAASAVPIEEPRRLFLGEIAEGSAAARLIALSDEGAGVPLTQIEQRWLARDVDTVIDNEIDGRLVTVNSSRGDRFSISLERSRQGLRQLPIERDENVAPLPDDIVLQGGWFAATQRTPLRPTPAADGAFRSRMLEPGVQIQRLGTVTDRYGDRWYLMGQRGVAVGYVSPADVTPSGAYEGALKAPYARGHGATITDTPSVFTRCRTITIGWYGEAGDVRQVCRSALGHWIPAET
ncbi:MAG: hypothetical protein AAGJ29_14095, partial [Pseudomonadota bacterium]